MPQGQVVRTNLKRRDFRNQHYEMRPRSKILLKNTTKFGAQHPQIHMMFKKLPHP